MLFREDAKEHITAMEDLKTYDPPTIGRLAADIIGKLDSGSGKRSPAHQAKRSQETGDTAGRDRNKVKPPTLSRSAV